MLGALLHELRAAEHGGAVRAVILRGRGGNFCAGRAMDAASSEANAQDGRIAISTELACFLAETTLATVSLVEGYAVGVGMSIAVWCDIALAADNAVFIAPELERGIPPTVTAATLLRSLPEKKAMWMLLTGMRVSAAEAEAWDLVTEVVPAGDIAAREADLAARLGSVSPTALRSFKKFRADIAAMEWREVMEVAHRTSMAAVVTEDAREGARAFRERRRPNWTKLI
jgi:enoyl-CoA hydratase/carnithine racemase